MVVLSVTWIANQGREAEVAEVFRQLARDSRSEPGCLMYVAHQHRTEPARFLIYEQYVDEAALEAHRASAHFIRDVRGKLPSIAVRAEAGMYTALD